MIWLCFNCGKIPITWSPDVINVCLFYLTSSKGMHSFCPQGEGLTHQNFLTHCSLLSVLTASFTWWLYFYFYQTRTCHHSLHRSLSVKPQNVVIWLPWSLPFAFHNKFLSVHTDPCHPLYLHWLQSKKSHQFSLPLSYPSQHVFFFCLHYLTYSWHFRVRNFTYSKVLGRIATYISFRNLILPC